MDRYRTRLQASLTFNRQHVLGIVDGLSDEQLRRAVLPSGWSCAELVNHLAADVERFWFLAVVRGDDDVWAEIDSDDGPGWPATPGDDGAAILDRYRAAIRRADEVIENTPLDAPPARWPDFFGSYRLDDLEGVMLHCITETATHAGHLDAVRELIDGTQWMVL